ncbi:transcriptional-regulating factor 1-like [Narcine bancroftii]|uniref:transcriptional-regulating factor 1-like n=1 Tax=Narcine bancroftii TaxID=1343680 RepID=UPI003831997E
MSEVPGLRPTSDLPPLLFFERSCPSGLGLEGCEGPGDPCYGIDGLDTLQPPEDGSKMAVATSEGWAASDPGGEAQAKREGANHRPLAYPSEGRLDSFDEAFAPRLPLGQAPPAHGSAQMPMLSQVLEGRVAQGPRYRILAQARRTLRPQAFPQRMAGESGGQPWAQYGPVAQQWAGQQCRSKAEPLPQAAMAPGTQFVYRGRQHYCLQDVQGPQLYPDHSQGSAVQTASPQYVTTYARQDCQVSSEPAWNPCTSKHVASHICPTDIYWDQVHQGLPSCDRLTSQRRAVEEREEGSYPFSCGYCKEQFRNILSFQAHVGSGGCMGRSHTVTQNNGQKASRDAGHLSPHLPTSALPMKVLGAKPCGQATLLMETPGDFLSRQEMTMLDMADYWKPETAEATPIYRSYLRVPGGDQDGMWGPPCYTPPPMLDPLRKAAGLFTAVSPHDPFPCTQFNRFDDVAQGGNTGGNSPSPCINVGPCFQAVVPEWVERRPAQADVHGADLVWSPWPQLMESEEVQRQVEDLLNMASSSALPGGGLNREFALHCLSQVNGDILVTLEKLLLNNGARSPSHPLADYHYTGSSNWSSNERRIFNKAFTLHRKDFTAVQRMVRTKLLAECVEYYYTFKKSLKFNKKQRVRTQDADEEWINIFGPDTEYEVTFTGLQPVHSGGSPSVVGNFPCKQCGKMFYKIKSRNAHMKIHRQQDDWQHRSQEALLPQIPCSTGNPPATAPLHPSWGHPEVQLPCLYHQDSEHNPSKGPCQNYYL